MKLMHYKPATLEAVNDAKVVKRGSQKNRRHTPPQGSPNVRFPGTLPALEERIQYDGAVFAIGAEVVQVTTTADILGIEAETTTDWTYADSSAQGGLRLSGLSFSAPSERKNMEGINPAAEVIFLNSTQDDIEKIIDAVARNALPHTEGFFFGVSDGSEREETLRIFRDALQWLRTTEPNVFRSVHYQASW